MGYFERHFSAVGEAVDEGIDRARDKTRDLCDTSGWSDRAERARDNARERSESAQRAVTERWRALGEDHQKTLLVALAVAGVLAVVFVGRSFLIDRPSGPSQVELQLVEQARRQSATGGHWAATGKPTSATPWGRP